MKAGAILVTGASGLLGNAVADHLSRGHRVYALVREPPQHPLPEVEYLIADLRQINLKKVLPKHIGHIVHLAQSRRYLDMPGGARDVVDINVSSTVSMLDYARDSGASSFIYASSGGIYSSSFSVKTEDSPIRNTDSLTPYFASKILGESLSKCYQNYFDIKILRFFFIYSPEQFESGLVGRLRSKIMSDQVIQLEGDGPKINPIHVLDAAVAVEKAMLYENSIVLNVAGDEIVRLRRLISMIGKQLKKPPIVKSSGRSTESLVADIGRMKKLLFVPEHKLSRAFAVSDECMNRGELE